MAPIQIKIKLQLLVLALIMLGLNSCFVDGEDIRDTTGKKPIYANFQDLNDIGNLGVQPTLQSGPIFLRNDILYITELLKGIHVYNVADSSNVEYITFIKIPAVTDFTISGDRLYADSWKDLLTINIADIKRVELVSRQEDVIEPLLVPPLYNGWFECVDEDLGAVIDWEISLITRAKCRTF